MLFLRLVLEASSSLRGSSQSMEIVSTIFPSLESVPSWTCGRMWLLRLGYYKLERPKEPGNDWIWIVDHTIQIGVTKCMTILGIRQCHLPKPGLCLKYEDVEPIAILPVKKSNGKVVYEQLEASTEKTGVPLEIVGDLGSDLKSGIEQYCQAHPETSYIYDIKHKTATWLKRQLKNDDLFKKLIKLVTATKQQVQQTPLAGFIPPNQRTKARYMNVDILVNWGQNILCFLDKQNETPHPDFDQKLIEEKLGWVIEFRDALSIWKELLLVISLTEDFVKKQGIYYNCALDLSFILPFDSPKEQTNQLIIELLEFVNKESIKSQNLKRLLGSSEILESSFAKQKQLEKEQSKSGFTSLILGLAAFVSTTTNEVVQKALETVSTRDVINWTQETIGKSVQALRREIFATASE